jgi:arsenate reductase
MSKSNVLFLCTGNSARSQLGEALLRKHAGDVFNVYSAGTEPKGVHPLTVRVLAEIGVATDELRSKDVGEFLGRLPVHYLIIVCGAAEATCPATWPLLQERLFWPFDDPAAATDSETQRLAKFRAVRDQIDERILAWLEDLREAGEID